MWWFAPLSMHSHTFLAFVIWGSEGISSQKAMFCHMLGLLQFYSTACVDQSTSYTHKIKIPIRKKMKDFCMKNFWEIKKKFMVQMCFSSSLKTDADIFFSIIIFCLLVLSFPNPTSAIFVSIWHAGDLFVHKASPYRMQLLCLLTYLNTIICCGLHSSIWMDSHDKDLNDPPVETFLVFALYCVIAINKKRKMK